MLGKERLIRMEQLHVAQTPSVGNIPFVVRAVCGRVRVYDPLR